MRIGIIGAGISGITLALELSNYGYESLIFEKRNLDSILEDNYLSFNYTINFRGKKFFEKIGIWDLVHFQSQPLIGRAIYEKKQLKVIQSYTAQNSEVLYSIPRVKLLKILLDKLKLNNRIKLHQCTKIKDIIIGKENVIIETLEGCSNHNYSFDFIIGADGAESQVRKKFDGIFNSKIETFEWNYIDIQLSKSECKKLKLSNKHIHVWPEKDYIGVGIPNNDYSLSLLHIFKFNKDSMNCAQMLKEQLETYLGSIKEAEDFKFKRLGRMLSVETKIWSIKDKVVLIGDAAHAFLPFLGQGMNAAIQDVEILANFLQLYPRDESFSKFSYYRKPQTDFLKKKSKKHFEYLKNIRKFDFNYFNQAFDLYLSNRFKKLWVNEYSALSNSSIDISTLKRRLRFQKVIQFTPIYISGLTLYICFSMLRNRLKLAITDIDVSSKAH